MNHSQIATAISISQLIKPFNDKDVNTFKKSLYNQFNIQNDAQFISKFLVYAAANVPHVILSDLHNNARKIATQGEYPPIKQSSNPLSKLSSDIIRNIGTLLTQEDCIQLGYTNQHLYIETQSKSFIINRRPTHIHKEQAELFNIEENCLRSLCTSNQTGFGYNFPKSMQFDEPVLDRHDTFYTHSIQSITNNIIKCNIWNNLFYSLYSLRVLNTTLIGHIPIDILFNKKNNQSNKLRLFKLDCMADVYDDSESSYGRFIENYTNYFEKECDKDLTKIRRIQTLKLMSSCGETREEHYFDLKLLFEALNCNFETLILDSIWLKNVDYKCLLKYVLHENLKELKLQGCNLSKDLTHWIRKTKILSNKEKSDIKKEHKCCCLESLLIILNDNGDDDDDEGYGIKNKQILDIWKLLINLQMVDHVTKLVIGFSNDVAVRQSLNIGSDIDKGWLGSALANSKVLNSLQELQFIMIDDYDDTSTEALETTCCLFEQIVAGRDCLRAATRCTANGKCLKYVRIMWNFDGFNVIGVDSEVSPRDEWECYQKIEKNENWKLHVISKSFKDNNNGKVMVETDLSQESMSIVYKNLFPWIKRVGEQYSAHTFERMFRLSLQLKIVTT